MQNSQQPVTFKQPLDFLRIIAGSCREYSETSDFDQFYTTLKNHVFCNLGNVSLELYFQVGDTKIFFPYASQFKTEPDHVRRTDNSNFPSHIDINNLLLGEHTISRETILFSNDPGVLSALPGSDNASHVLLPLPQEERLTAILYAGCKERVTFPDHYLEGLEAIAVMINSRMKSMKIITDLRNSMASFEYAERLGQALYAINEQAHLVQSEEELFASLHAIVGRFINARNFFIALREERQGEQYIRFTYFFDEKDPHFQGMEIKIDPQEKQSFTSYLLHSGEPILLGPDSFDQFCRDNAIRHLGTKSHSLIGVPFFLDQLAGVVMVQSYHEIIYSEKDRDLLVYVARHIGDALGRKKTMDDMRDTNELFSEFMRYSPVHVYIKEVTPSTSRVLQASENFKNMIGKSGTEIIGRTMTDLFPPELAAKITADDWKVVNDGKALQVEEHLHGQTYTTIKFPITKGGKKLLAGYTINISERKAMEEALRESERRYRIIFEKSPLGVIRYDSEGTMLDFNDKFIEIMGSSREKLLGFNSLRQSTPKVREAIAKALAGEISSFEELYTSVTGGKTSYIRGIFNPVNPGRKPTDVIATIEDITEQKAYEKEQHKIEKLESLGLLAGGIAHDFNNILTGITANISFAKVFIEPEHKSCSPLAEAERASRRAAELARQLLTFARGGEPNKKVISLQHIIGEAISLMLRGSNVRAIVDVGDQVEAVKADEGQISQVFNNMIINAAQAMPDGGTLTIYAENASIPAANSLDLFPGSYVRIKIKDEGCGISPENKEKIFDPYFTTKKDGTGLGLASAYSIIHRHQGHITVDSASGCGTVFSIYLPSTGAPYTDHLDISSRKSNRHTGGAILVMDDEEMIRSLAEHVLRHLGYEVTTCASGEEAIEMYTRAVELKTPIKAVIMDLTIPGGLGGKKTAEILLARFPAACLIVSSGYSNDPIMANYKEYGFFGRIAKPYNIDEFEQVLSSLPES